MDVDTEWLRMANYLKAYRNGYTGTLYQFENEPNIKRTRIRSRDGLLLNVRIQTKSQQESVSS